MFDEVINRDYKDIIEIKLPAIQKPMLKLAKLPSALSEIEIREHLLHQNDILEHNDFEIMRRYEVKSETTSYANIIFTTSLEKQKQLLEKGFLVLNLNEYPLFEHNNLIQCVNCVRFGHISSE